MQDGCSHLIHRAGTLPEADAHVLQFMDQINHLGCPQAHLLQLLVAAEHLLGCAVHLQLAVVQHQNVLRVAGHIIHGMRNQEDGHAGLLMERLDLPEQVIPACRIQSCRGLIQNKNLRLHGQHTGNGHASLLAAGKLEGGFLPVVLRESYPPQCLLRPGSGLLRGKPLVLRTEHDIGDDINFKKLVLRILENQSHLEAESLHVEALAVDADEIAVNMLSGLARTLGTADIILLCLRKAIPEAIENIPLAAPEQTVQMLRQRGFAGAGMPYDSRDDAALHLKIQVPQGIALHGCPLLINMGQLFHPQNRVRDLQMLRCVLHKIRCKFHLLRQKLLEDRHQLRPGQYAVRQRHARLLQLPGQLCHLRHIHADPLQALHLGEDLPRCAVHHDFALVHDNDAVGVHRLFHVMSDEYDGDLFFLIQPAHCPDHLGPAAGVQHGCGLVKHDAAGQHGHGARDGDTLLLTTREAIG